MALRMSTKQARELGIIPKPAPATGGMNSLEERYAGYMKQTGLIYYFEPWKLILVHGIPHQRREVTYKVDFLVLNRFWMPWFDEPRYAHLNAYHEKLFQWEIHEVKGYWREDARLKIKFAAEKCPYLVFKGVTLNRKERIWEFESF